MFFLCVPNDSIIASDYCKHNYTDDKNCHIFPNFYFSFILIILGIALQGGGNSNKKAVDIFIKTSYNISCLQEWWNWQTRRLQVPVVAIPCGFKSHLLHWKSAKSNTSCSGSALFVFLFRNGEKPYWVTLVTRLLSICCYRNKCKNVCKWTWFCNEYKSNWTWKKSAMDMEHDCWRNQCLV